MQRAPSAAIRVYRIGLINGLVRYLCGNNPTSIHRCADMREFTTHEGIHCKRPLARIRELSNLAGELGLLIKTRGVLTLTATGEQYAAHSAELWEVSEQQAAILRKRIVAARSNSTMAILLTMARLIQRHGQVSVTRIMDQFTATTGMLHRWTIPITRQSSTTYALNYLTEMGITRQGGGRTFSLTAEGVGILHVVGPAPRPRVRSRHTSRPPATGRLEKPPATAALLDRLVRQSGRNTERRVIAKRRLGQALLRTVMLRLYDGCCALCEIRERTMLRASHITRWSWRKDVRLEPSNAILLCVSHDALFEHGLITLTDGCQVLLSPRLDLARSPGLRPLVEDVRFRQPHRHAPLPAYLAAHRRYHDFSSMVHN